MTQEKTINPIHAEDNFDYWLVAYVNEKGEQIAKPYYDDENGKLKQVAMFYVYSKQPIYVESLKQKEVI